MTVPIVIYTKKHFYLNRALNEKIDSMNVAGLIEYWYSKQFLKEIIKEEKSPEVLTFVHLSGCFQIWAGGCVLSLTVFVAEFVTHRSKRNFFLT